MMNFQEEMDAEFNGRFDSVNEAYAGTIDNDYEAYCSDEMDKMVEANRAAGLKDCGCADDVICIFCDPIEPADQD